MITESQEARKKGGGYSLIITLQSFKPGYKLHDNTSYPLHQNISTVTFLPHFPGLESLMRKEPVLFVK
jgi:hypothetical protein